MIGSEIKRFTEEQQEGSKIHAQHVNMLGLLSAGKEATGQW